MSARKVIVWRADRWHNFLFVNGAVSPRGVHRLAGTARGVGSEGGLSKGCAPKGDRCGVWNRTACGTARQGRPEVFKSDFKRPPSNVELRDCIQDLALSFE